MQHPHSEVSEKLDILEHGAPINGKPQTSNRRLYMQLQVFTGVTDIDGITKELEQSNLDAALYLDANDPHGIGIVFLTEAPNLFVTDIRSLLNSEPFDLLDHRPELTMLGRTYATGYEPDLEHALIGRPKGNVLNPDLNWAIYYPLRRNGAFARLDHKEQRQILMEHASIGRAYGRENYAHDIRLASYGLDVNDNDFVIGLIGKELYPLSRVVQDMRKTQQTALYVESLGPFFIGKKIWGKSEK
ncbi:MAG: chlorite dismutase family protein [Candidatus Latescibacteria bacterium]|nr:chlorite dismutase family protein [Candidatus Latescibacterota bacterium]